ncbi:TetR/AcrR family transcriptional regulator [Amycolatopsis benzoatilytica]|uniref:TetR/AcrR family transcriptional regulator n=1 Tax=Amycolatopsis benzoatilytica TaxID=346045 RepID=UPI00035C9951|nr:TetR/AcrR family transcriptional regulator [Amycolatopsis benzoatilytica]
MEDHEDHSGSRKLVGAALPSQKVSRAIRDACVAELTERGYRAMTMEAVARRAGVGKAALYRRFPGKQELTLATIREVTDVLGPDSVDGQDRAVPSAGSLRDDVRALVGSTERWLHDPRIFSDLIAEGQRDPEFLSLLRTTIARVRERPAARIAARARERGEPVSTDALDLAADLAVAGVFWRIAVSEAPMTETYLDEVTDLICAALTATSTSRTGA